MTFNIYFFIINWLKIIRLGRKENYKMRPLLIEVTDTKEMVYMYQAKLKT